MIIIAIIMTFDRKIFDIIARVNTIRDEAQLIREFPKTYGKYFKVDQIVFFKTEIRRSKDKSIKTPIVGLRNAMALKEPLIYIRHNKELEMCYKYQKPVKKVSKDSVVYLFPMVDYKEVHYILRLRFDRKDVGDYMVFRKAMSIFLNHFITVRSQDRDFLTGLFNRRAFDRLLGTFHTGWKRTKKPGRNDFLALIDLDNFKKINDSHGHMIGDEVLLLFSRLLRINTRVEDTLFRLGGEEFLVFARDLSLVEAHDFFDRLRNKIAHESFPRGIHLTGSIGYTKFDYSKNPNTMVDHADKAMYSAKENGRNRVCYYGTLEEDEKFFPAPNEGGGPISVWE